MPMPSGGPPGLGDYVAWAPSTGWLTVAAVLGAAYLVGVRSLARGGVRWGWARTASWILALASLLLVTTTGLATYGMALFSAHMVQHMVVGMLTPILLLCGAPVTLALRALPNARGRRGAPRRVLLRLLHSRFLLVVAHPMVTVPLFIASLYGLYFTSLLDVAMSSSWGHTVMLVHFLVVGVLFFGPILAIDPWPHHVSHGARLLELLVAMPFHAFFGVAVMASTIPLSPILADASRALSVDPVADQSRGGGIAWAFGEIPIVIVAAIVFVQWVRADLRSGRRYDRQAARETSGYGVLPLPPQRLTRGPGRVDDVGPRRVAPRDLL